MWDVLSTDFCSFLDIFIFMVIPRLEHRDLIELGLPQTAFPEPYENIEIGDRALIGRTLTRADVINIT